MKRLFAALLLLVTAMLVVPVVNAQAREEIRNYDVVVNVLADGTLDVTETITVNAEGGQIRRGIYRDIPMRELDDWGLWSDHGFDLVSVTRNGADEAYHTEWQERFIRIYAGDAEVFLPSGVHTYEFRYRTTRQLRYFDEYDEIYWNATGNFWNFPILNASVTVNLPEGAVAKSVAAYTGGFGAKSSNYRATGEGTSTVRFVATQSFAEREGITVAVGFTKGVVAIQQETAGTKFWTNFGLFVFFCGWLIMPAYYLFAWTKVGRDPPERAIIPLFHPPDDLEAAALSYVHFNGFRMAGSKDLAFIAALLSLGVKKKLVIEEKGRSSVTLIRSKELESAQKPLSQGEAALFDRLLGSRDEFPLDKSNGTSLLAAQTAFRRTVSKLYSGKYYKVNLGWFIPGIVLGAVTFILGMILQNPPEDGLLYVIPVVMTSVIGCIFMTIGRRFWTDPLRGAIKRIAGGILLVAGFIVIALGALVVAYNSGLPIYQLVGALLIFGICFTFLMYFLMGAPTPLGAEVLPRIEGFKLYLETAETNRLNMREAPEMSEELFERYLPYAAGLGVEEPWSKAWAAHLSRIAPNRDQHYEPHWYHGRSGSYGNIGVATAASVAAVSAAMASAMPAPQSSSGSSGGGSSGGGGGGGGGGGW